MTIQDQITALCAEAEPLRSRHDGGGDELAALVEQINELRVIEANGSALTFEQRQENKAIARGIENTFDRKPNPGEVEFFGGTPDAPKRGRKPKEVNA